MSAPASVLVVGFGNMGQALVRGWLGRGRPAARIRSVDPRAEALDAARGLGIEAAAELGEGETADVVVIAVKPDQVAGALPRYRALAASGAVFLSIVAGKSLGAYRRLLGPAPVVRAMPNTPAAIGEGMTALCANDRVDAAQRAICGELMEAVGAVVWVEDERHMDAVTAVSGSGPAYVFLLIECLVDAGVAAGLPAETAQRLAVETVAGAGAYARVADVDAAELRRRVTSPGGTTQAALEVLTAEPGMGDLIERAVLAAAARSRELSGD